MAWNRPSERERGIGNREQGARKFPFRGLVAGIIVVLGAGIAAWLMWPSDETRQDAASTKKPSHIREATPAAARTNKVVAAKKLTNEERLKQIYDKYGDDIPDNLKATVSYLKNPPKRGFSAAKTKNSIFKHHSERMIGSILDVAPGDYFVRKPTFDERFDREFAAALADPTVIDSSDTEEERERKRLVSETMAEMADRVRGGEKASAIMAAAVDDLSSLGKYRRDLERQIMEFKTNDKYTNQDITDFVTAANEMLKKKGAKELAMPRFLTRSIMLKKLEKRRAEQAKSEQEGK